MEAQTYSACMDVMQSDHKPVCALLNVMLPNLAPPRARRSAARHALIQMHALWDASSHQQSRGCQPCCAQGLFQVAPSTAEQALRGGLVSQPASSSTSGRLGQLAELTRLICQCKASQLLCQLTGIRCTHFVQGLSGVPLSAGFPPGCCGRPSLLQSLTPPGSASRRSFWNSTRCLAIHHESVPLFCHSHALLHSH